MNFLQQKLARLQQELEAKPHRPVKTGSANAQERRHTCQQVSTLYEEPEHWQDSLRAYRWQHHPKDQVVPRVRLEPNKPHFIIAHLLSGRRRLEKLRLDVRQNCLSPGQKNKLCPLSQIFTSTKNDTHPTITYVRHACQIMVLCILISPKESALCEIAA